jgi:hypothetical protein
MAMQAMIRRGRKFGRPPKMTKRRIVNADRKLTHIGVGAPK